MKPKAAAMAIWMVYGYTPRPLACAWWWTEVDGPKGKRIVLRLP